MGGSSGGSSTTVQKADPWSGQQPFLKDIFGQAQSQYYNLPTQFYPGATYAPMNPLEQSGLRAGLSYGTSPYLSGMIGGTQGALGQMLDAPNVASNPYVQDMSDVLTQRIGRDFQEQIMPGIRTTAQNVGQLGSSRHGVAEGIASGRALDAMAAARAGLMSDAYGRGLEQQARGMALAPSTMNLGFMPSQVMGSVGGALRGEQEKMLQDDIARWQASMAYPRADLAGYSTGVMGQYGGTTTTTGPEQGSSPLMGGLGGAMMGASAFPMLTGSSLMGAPVYGAGGSMLSAGALNPAALPFIAGGALLGGMFS